VRGLNARFEAAVAAIDLANAADPNAVTVRAVTEPLALVHGRLAMAWVARLVPDADETLLLAARAHHLRRWELPRTAYAEGKVGYHQWKRDQRARHARDVESLLVEAGYDPAAVTRVQALIRRDDLRTDAGAQAIEDAACLVFLETQLAPVSTRLDHDHLVDVLRKTARKLSPAGLAAVADVPLAAAERALLDDALRPDSG
jgi:predicted Zn-dependent protease